MLKFVKTYFQKPIYSVLVELCFLYIKKFLTFIFIVSVGLFCLFHPIKPEDRHSSYIYL